MKPIKVLHVSNIDKANYYLRNLAAFNDPRQVEYSFATFQPEGCDFVVDLKDAAYAATGLGGVSRKGYPMAYARLAALIKKERPDIVHAHLFDPSLMALTAAKRRGIKTVLTRHHSDAIHEIASPAKRRFYLALENYISRKSDHIIAPSRTVRDYLLKEGVTPEKVSVIPYGQTTERFDAVTDEAVAAVRHEFGMGENLSLVCNSRLFHRKGHIFLFEALSALVSDGLDATLYLVGEGEQATLKQRAVEFGIADRVRFLGWRGDVLTIMKAADIIVHPSLEDALSSAVIEAVMLEKPIVATDISGVRDTLDDGKYGEIVEPANAASFRKGLEKTVKEIDLARERARKGRKYLLEYMDAGRVSDEYLRVYREVAPG